VIKHKSNWFLTGTLNHGAVAKGQLKDKTSLIESVADETLSPLLLFVGRKRPIETAPARRRLVTTAPARSKPTKKLQLEGGLSKLLRLGKGPPNVLLSESSIEDLGLAETALLEPSNLLRLVEGQPNLLWLEASIDGLGLSEAGMSCQLGLVKS
jgi:hypothetical protein